MDKLPDNCLQMIFEELGLLQQIGIERVCKHWRNQLFKIYNTIQEFHCDEILYEILHKKLNTLKYKKSMNEMLEAIMLRFGNSLENIIIKSTFLGSVNSDEEKLMQSLAQFFLSKSESKSTCDLDFSLSQFMKDISRYCNKLECLNVQKQLNNNESSVIYDQDLALVFLNNRNLKGISLNNLSINGKCLLNLPLESLEEIIISNCNNLDAHNITSSFSRLKKLRNIEIVNCNVAEVAVKALSLSGAMNIKHFELISRTNVDFNKDLISLFSKQTNLKSVVLQVTDVKKDCLSSLPRDSIECIDLCRHMNVAIVLPETLSVLPEFVNLTDLSISMRQMNDESAKAISSCKKLKNLTLSFVISSRLTSSGEKYFSNLLNLETFTAVQNECVTDGFLDAISKCKQLNSVELMGCAHVTDKGVKHLASLPNLKKLDIPYLLDVSDKSLCLFKNLEKLDCSNNTDVESKGLCELIKNSPNLILLKVLFCENVTKEIIDAAVKMKKVSSNQNTLKIFVQSSGIDVKNLKNIPSSIEIIEDFGIFDY